MCSAFHCVPAINADKSMRLHGIDDDLQNAGGREAIDINGNGNGRVQRQI